MLAKDVQEEDKVNFLSSLVMLILNQEGLFLEYQSRDISHPSKVVLRDDTAMAASCLSPRPLLPFPTRCSCLATV